MENNPTVIHEDERMLVINKPAGLVVHGDGRTKESTLADWLIAKYPDIQNVGEPWENEKGETILRPGIVHRLDRETSGVMVIAKTQDAFEFLKEQFQERTIKKTYRAFAYDTFKESEGEINRPIGKSKTDFRKWSAQPGSRGVQREAHTLWEVLKSFEEKGEMFTYLNLTPTTGRTHQLRVHLKAIHHPIVCDKLYAPKRACALGFNRLALHAYSLDIPTGQGNTTTFTAPLPADFITALGE
ncbi:RluA family pseudouridine synthase [Candidatus Kaiserbacteria bacterium]|nr:MAG: RluA family pseudouridine synthase [Candidatus Kaiserbacteria bacterium]